MKRLLLAGCLLGALVFGQEHPAEAGRGASEDAHRQEQENPHEIYWKWANFALLAGGLGYLVAKNAGPFFRGRTQEIQQGMAEAGALKAAAEARATEMEQRLARLDEEIAALRHQARDEMKAEAARQEAELAQALGKVHEQAEREMASQLTLARQELKAYSAQLALELAERNIRQQLSPAVQGDLVSRFGSDLLRVQGDGNRPAGVQ